MGGTGGTGWGYGGSGLASSITGSSITYAAGGQAGENTAGGQNGAANSGDGAGGGWTFTNGGTGGSGVVIISYPKSWRAATTTGSPTVTTTSTNRVYKFTSSGSITF